MRLKKDSPCARRIEKGIGMKSKVSRTLIVFEKKKGWPGLQVLGVESPVQQL